MTRGERAVIGKCRSTAANRRCQLRERPAVGFPSDGGHNRADVCGRVPIEKRARVRAQSVALAVLPEEADNSQVVAEDADATLCGEAPP
jgi:hypothetical protein